MSLTVNNYYSHQKLILKLHYVVVLFVKGLNIYLLFFLVSFVYDIIPSL